MRGPSVRHNGAVPWRGGAHQGAQVQQEEGENMRQSLPCHQICGSLVFRTTLEVICKVTRRSFVGLISTR